MSITSAVLKVCHIKVADAVVVAQNEVLGIGPAIYPYWKSNFKTISIPSGVSAVSSDDIFHGEVPSKLILDIVRTDAFSGDYKLNPYNFLHVNVNYLELSVDGQSVPAQPLKPNFESGDYTISFFSMYTKQVHEFSEEEIGLLENNTPMAIHCSVSISRGRQGRIYLQSRKGVTPDCN